MKNLFENKIIKASYLTIVCLFLLIILKSCAIPMAPTGGPRDETPPKVQRMTPENESINFNRQSFSIAFDEYIELNNQVQEIIITPSLAKFPEMVVKGKTLNVNFGNNKLEENTTYSIQFGNAIRDLNESNVLPDLNYVFSTGSYIDSMLIGGVAVNSATGQPMKGVKALLYRSITDSAIYKKRPQYFARTADDGTFFIKNLPQDSFYMYAINDKNENYLLDADEEVAFVPNRIRTMPDGEMPVQTMQLYMPEPDITEIRRYSFSPPAFSVRFAKKADSVSVFREENGRFLPFQYLKISPNRDSISGWVRNLSDTIGFKLRVILDGTKIDTTIIRGKGAIVSLRPTINAESGKDVFNDFKVPAKLNFNMPVARIDKTKLILMQDSIKLPTNSVNIKFTDSSRVTAIMNFTHKEATDYKVTFLPGFITTIYNTTIDTMEALISIPNRENYGFLTMNVIVDNASPYIFQIMNESGQVAFERYLTANRTIEIPYFESGSYKVRFVEDINRNRRWDPGSLTADKQPEKIYFHPEELKVKANWEMADLVFDVTKLKK